MLPPSSLASSGSPWWINKTIKNVKGTNFSRQFKRNEHFFSFESLLNNKWKTKIGIIPDM